MKLGKYIKHSIWTLVFTITAVGSAHAQSLPEVSRIAEEYAQTVVNISTSTKVDMSRPVPENHPFKGTPFENFFNEFFEQMPQQQQGAQSLGSGVVISADGYVVTNNHVVENADEISVRFVDEREYQAAIVGRDPKNDLALLKIETAKPLKFASLGDSESLKIGQWVVAIGNPFGLGGTVTAGIISGRGRHIGQGPYDDFLQTDAAINPGNSGGPLFNLDGDIVGINTAILTRSGGSNGIGFAIPSNTVKHIVNQLKEHGRPIRGWLGVKIQSVTDELAEALGIESDYGALVAEVSEDSPAASAGIQTGDLIIKYDGKRIDEMIELPRYVAETEIGKQVEVVILRDGRKTTLSVTIKELEEDQNVIANTTGSAEKAGELLGLSLGDITQRERQQFRLNDNAKGAIILMVQSGSPAAKAGLRSGDIILRVNQEDVTTADQAASAIKGAQGNSLLLLIQRAGNNTFVPLKREAAE